MMTPIIVAAAADPFAPFPGMEVQANKGKGKGRGNGGNQPPVPESAAYGAIFVALCVLVWISARTLRRAKGCCGRGCRHHHD